MYIDLQLHSIYSDGYLTPRDLARFVHRAGVQVAALTDHNTVAGQTEFRQACLKYGIKTITGLELYVKVGHRKVNLLWYNFNDKHPELLKILVETQKRRRVFVRKILERLVRAGFRVNIKSLLDKYSDYIPVNHIIDEIWRDVYNRRKTRKELDVKRPREEDLLKAYFYNKKIGALADARIGIKRVLRLRKIIGGQLVFCHPGHGNRLANNMAARLKKIGVDGIEVLSPHHSYSHVMHIQFLAKELDLIATGGSDFHRFEGNNYALQSAWQWYKIDSQNLRRIKEIIG